MSNKRASLRREWRADRKDLKKIVKFCDWNPHMFNDVRAALRKFRKANS